MSRLPGTPKTGGRVKGKKNKRGEVWEIVKSLNFDPVNELLAIHKIAMSAYEDHKETKQGPEYLSIAQKSCTDLMQYIYPKLKALEIKDDTPNKEFSLKYAIKQQSDDKPKE